MSMALDLDVEVEVPVRVRMRLVLIVDDDGLKAETETSVDDAPRRRIARTDRDCMLFRSGGLTVKSTTGEKVDDE